MIENEKVFIWLYILLSIAFVVVTPVDASNQDPDRYWYEGWVEVIDRGPTVYVETRIRGYNSLYRGYLGFDEEVAGYYFYEGWLYREPLPYPKPTSQPEELEDHKSAG